jgi:glutamate dehydrogenase
VTHVDASQGDRSERRDGMPATLPQVKVRIDRAPAAEARLLAPFTEALFSKVDEAFLEQFDAEALYAMAKEGLAFLDGLGNESCRVEVLNPSYRADGWEAPFTVVRLALRDRPFIVDSVQNELRRQGFDTLHLLHPIYAVARDGDGRITSLGWRDTGGEREAFEMYFVEHEPQAARRDALRIALERVLRDVILATDDYAAMRDAATRAAEYLRELRRGSAQGPFRDRGEELEEYASFLEWLDDDNFVFVGYREYDIVEGAGERTLRLVPDSGLGVLRNVERSAYRKPVPLAALPPGLRERIEGGRIVEVTKANAESTVHRAARFDYVGVKKLSDGWQVQGERRFLGLLTTKAHFTATDQIPILRRKLRRVLELDGAIPGSHDYKQIVEIFNSMPRPDLFWSESEHLHAEIRAIMGIVQERGVRLTVRPDPHARGLAVMVVLPRDRFNATVRRRIQTLLAAHLQATHVDYQLAMGEDEAQVRLHFFFTTAAKASDLDVRALENEVGELTRTWEDHLRERLLQTRGDREGRRLADRYVRAFEDRYTAETSATRALADIEQLEALADGRVKVDLVTSLDDRRREDVTLLRIYHPGASMALSDVLPLLEDVGFSVLEQVSYVVRPSGDERGIEVFKVQDQHGGVIDVRRDGERLVEATERLLRGEAEADRLNRLVLYAGLTIREVALLRTYQMYYAQLSAVTSRRFINATLLAHPGAAKALFRVFEVKFDPRRPGMPEERAQALAAAREAYLDELASVSSLPEDQLLRGLLNLVDATVRTNYYLERPAISIKLRSADVDTMPAPRPMFEIAVASPDMEGTHLRGGKVARGGIRWSDRPDDFRTEVLGLMKTQMTKNAVIVPVGSKGGFIVKRAPLDRDALRAYVETQYTTYIRSLLDITDNRVAERARHPDGVVIYDDADPYLVVAADKGTATFSDLANGIAEEERFWLGDAFASGGSQGYDHKREGITARGAWEAVKRHFLELGRDPMTEPITVAGIGDMSGDVFGNGLLYSDQLRLVAAFNHQHVMIDPNPDAASSYRERQRLFALPRSTWADYDRSVLSDGGMVVERGAKRITLTPQAQQALGLREAEISGQDLVRAVLRLNVDLLWNGGIGTYVKASHERHGEVGDATNDAVRIDATELRAKVVGEGGNLGLTQAARIEYARGGGRINTDAIDNSGGVDMSDHEVNIKLLLQPLMRSGELSPVQRERLLRDMTDEVSRLVLRNTARQALALTVAERRSRQDVRLFESLMEYLTERGDLDPQVEGLPTRRVFAERERSGEGLARPELAVLMAYVKMGLYRRLLETDLPNDRGLEHYLFDYFPRVLAERFPDAIRRHPLRREIAATQMTNAIVDMLGISFVHRTIRDTGAMPVELMRAGLTAMEVLSVEGLVARLDGLGASVPTTTLYGVLDEQVKAVEALVRWMLLNGLVDRPVEEFTSAYATPLEAVREALEELLPIGTRRTFRRSIKAFVKSGLPADLAREAASLEFVPSAMGVIQVAARTGVPLDVAGKGFYRVGDRLSLGWVRDRLAERRSHDRWETIALGGVIMDLRRGQQVLAERYVVAREEEERLGCDAFLSRRPNALKRYDDAVRRLREEGEVTLAAGSVLATLLAGLVGD